MTALCLTLLIVLVSDEAIKLLLRRCLGPRAICLGRFGSVRIVVGRLWLWRLGGHSNGVIMWCFWMAAAVPYVIASTRIPLSQVFVGLLLGGSFSQAVETSVRGSVTDYICLRFWPAFNLADLALAAGAIGIIGELLIVIRAMAF